MQLVISFAFASEQTRALKTMSRLLCFFPKPLEVLSITLISKTNPNYYICQVAIDENPHTLSCAIPCKFDDIIISLIIIN